MLPIPIVVSVVFLVFYIMNTKSAMKVQELKAEGKHIPTFKEELKQFGDEKFPYLHFFLYLVY